MMGMSLRKGTGKNEGSDQKTCIRADKTIYALELPYSDARMGECWLRKFDGLGMDDRGKGMKMNGAGAG